MRVLTDSPTSEEFIANYIETSVYLGGIVNSEKYAPNTRESREILGRLLTFTEGSVRYSQHRPPATGIIQTVAMDDQDQAAAMMSVKS